MQFHRGVEKISARELRIHLGTDFLPSFNASSNCPRWKKARFVFLVKEKIGSHLFEFVLVVDVQKIFLSTDDSVLSVDQTR